MFNKRPDLIWLSTSSPKSHFICRLNVTQYYQSIFCRCVSNCGAKVNPDARLSITSECEDNCEGLKYTWTLEYATSSQTTQDIWPNRTLTEQSSASLVVKAGTFKLKQVYIFKLRVENDHGKFTIQTILPF